MSDREEKITKLFRGAKKKKRVAPQENEFTSQSIQGDGNIQATGDVNINTKKIERFDVHPGPQHIAEAQAFKIKELIDKAVDIETKAGKNKGNLYAKWWASIKRKFKVTSYKLIPVDRGDEAIAWLQQQKAIKLPKIRRKDNPEWRKQLTGAIWARSNNQLGMTKQDVYNLVLTRIGKNISSLTDLGEQDLKKLHSVIFAMKYEKK